MQIDTTGLGIEIISTNGILIFNNKVI